MWMWIRALQISCAMTALAKSVGGLSWARDRHADHALARRPFSMAQSARLDVTEWILPPVPHVAVHVDGARTLQSR